MLANVSFHMAVSCAAKVHSTPCTISCQFVPGGHFAKRGSRYQADAWGTLGLDDLGSIYPSKLT